MEEKETLEADRYRRKNTSINKKKRIEKNEDRYEDKKRERKKDRERQIAEKKSGQK